MWPKSKAAKEESPERIIQAVDGKWQGVCQGAGRRLAGGVAPSRSNGAGPNFQPYTNKTRKAPNVFTRLDKKQRNGVAIQLD